MGYDDLFEPAKALEQPRKAGDAGQVRRARCELHELDQRIQQRRSPSTEPDGD